MCLTLSYLHSCATFDLKVKPEADNSAVLARLYIHTHIHTRSLASTTRHHPHCSLSSSLPHQAPQTMSLHIRTATQSASLLAPRTTLFLGQSLSARSLTIVFIHQQSSTTPACRVPYLSRRNQISSSISSSCFRTATRRPLQTAQHNHAYHANAKMHCIPSHPMAARRAVLIESADFGPTPRVCRASFPEKSLSHLTACPSHSTECLIQ